MASAAVTERPIDENSGGWNGTGSSTGVVEEGGASKPAPGPAGHVSSAKSIGLRNWHSRHLSDQAVVVDAERRIFGGSDITGGATWGVSLLGRYGAHAR